MTSAMVDAPDYPAWLPAVSSEEAGHLCQPNVDVSDNPKDCSKTATFGHQNTAISHRLYDAIHELPSMQMIKFFRMFI